MANITGQHDGLLINCSCTWNKYYLMYLINENENYNSLLIKYFHNVHKVGVPWCSG